MVYHHTCMLTTPRCTARTCSPREVDTLSSQVMQCTSSVADWMKSNRLQLNADKTEVMWCSTCRQQHQLPSSPMNVNGVSVVPVQSVRNLCIYIDADLVMRTNVQKTISRCFAVLRQWRQIRHSVPTETSHTLVVALVLSRLDYGNAGLVGLVHRLQSVMNASTRMIHRLRSSDHITDALALASHPGAHSVQGRSSRVQSASWTHVTVSRTLTHVSNLPGRHAFHLAGTNQLDYLFNCRRSGIRHCWPTKLEQSASSCDLSRDSYHVQTETKTFLFEKSFSL